MSFNPINTEAAKSASYALIKYGKEVHPDMDFFVCMKVCRGGILRLWLEDKDGRELENDYQTGDVHGNQ